MCWRVSIGTCREAWGLISWGQGIGQTDIEPRLGSMLLAGLTANSLAFGAGVVVRKVVESRGIGGAVRPIQALLLSLFLPGLRKMFAAMEVAVILWRFACFRLEGRVRGLSPLGRWVVAVFWCIEPVVGVVRRVGVAQ